MVHVSTALLKLYDAQQNRRKKYSAVFEGRRASFTPIVVSVAGILGNDVQYLMKPLGDHIAVK